MDMDMGGHRGMSTVPIKGTDLSFLSLISLVYFMFLIYKRFLLNRCRPSTGRGFMLKMLEILEGVYVLGVLLFCECSVVLFRTWCSCVFCGCRDNKQNIVRFFVGGVRVRATDGRFSIYSLFPMSSPRKREA